MVLTKYIAEGNLWKQVQDAQNGPGVQYSIAPEIADILRQQGADTAINDVRNMPFPDENELWNLFASEWNNSMQEQINTVMQNNDWITKKIFEKLWMTYVEWMKLFHSPGAVSVIEWWKLSHASFDDRHLSRDNQSGWGEEMAYIRSWVSRAYDTQILQWMSLQKATIASIIHAFKGQFELSTSLMQAVVWLLWNDIDKPEYFRGLYSHNGKSIGVSGSYVPHEMIDRVMTHLDPMDSIELDSISPVKNNKQSDEVVGRVDLLAGIFDELLARLVLHDVKDWEYHIEQVAKDLKFHFKTAQIHWDSKELWKLC